ncbi:hypothetical protein LTR50_007158 [Elasticomyces elasticus]|nr:hypothetical protein LTR50_007158 [Elasticomyces elasticus]
MAAQELRLLALDGGGVRGLSALIVLEQLMETIDPDSPPKPCDYFDMIGGTSTGGLIAIMLGRLRMSVGECIDAYLSLSDRIFQKNRHRVTMKGNIQGRFDSDELERAVKEIVTKQGLQADALLKDTSDNACKVFVCATSKQTSETMCLRSYKSPSGGSDLLNSVQIWQACRATSAASSFFDPITIGRFEEFVDGATGANNPVWEVWNQAQLMWGPQPVEGRVGCLVSIGTGVPSLKPFLDDVFRIGKTLVEIATETEQTAERFRQDKTHLDDAGRYFRFNVTRGLEDVGLEESKKRKEIAAATRRYIGAQEVRKQMQACAKNVGGKEYSGEYRTDFDLKGVPRVNKFVERPAQMAELERVLLPRRQSCRQRVFVLHGLGGIGKTQLAVEFARLHHRKFSSVFWLDGRSEDSLKRSVAGCASRITKGQISEASRTYSAGGSSDLDAVVTEVMGWLAQQDNFDWLLILDNVDREYNPRNPNPDAYDVKQYLPGADHGAVLITTRLATLEQIGDSQQLGKADEKQSEAILRSWYNGKYGKAERTCHNNTQVEADDTATDPVQGDLLLNKLDGLPLAIAQAGAFLQQSGCAIETYLKFYEQQWKKLMEKQDLSDALLQDYPDQGVWTTWTISFEAVREKSEPAANLLLLWSLLDNKSLWHGLLAEACNIASNELDFSTAVQLLRNYSLIEDVGDGASFATHPVVHRWAYHFQTEERRAELARLAVLVVGMAVPDKSRRDYWIMQRRLLPHAQACHLQVLADRTKRRAGSHDTNGVNLQEFEVLIAINRLGRLYSDQGKLAEAEEMWQRALHGSEEALGSKHVLTLHAVHNLGSVYYSQDKLAEAKQMYMRALQGYEEVLNAEHTSTLDTVINQGRLNGLGLRNNLEVFNNLDRLYSDQGKLPEAEEMWQRALHGSEEALGPTDALTVQSVQMLGLLYYYQGKLAEAEQMCQRALQGREEALGPKNVSTLQSVNNLGALYLDQGKLVEAEQMYQRALQGFEEALGAKHTSTLTTVKNLASLYSNQGKLAEAEQMYQRALQGFEEALGAKHTSTLNTVNNLASLYNNQGKLAEAEQMYQRALQGYEEALGLENVERYIPALRTMTNTGLLYAERRQYTEARQMFLRALSGFETVLGPSSDSCQSLKSKIEYLDLLSCKAQDHTHQLTQRANKLNYM